MHPAPSIVLFTVLSGLGLGQMVWLGLGLGPDDGLFRWLASALALGLAGAGGLFSTGHLGRRENAWRAFSQWRSSWLSREACLMVAAMAAFGLYAAIWCLGGVRLWGLGLAASALSVATIYSTAMIYAQLKTVPRWSVTPTPALFLVTGLTGGLLATGAVSGIICTPSCCQRSARARATTTDTRSRRRQAGRGGGQITTRARSSLSIRPARFFALRRPDPANPAYHDRWKDRT